MKKHRRREEKAISANIGPPSNGSNELSNALSSMRKSAGMTQRQVANAMQTTQSAIADMERGRTLPSTRTLQKFADATNYAMQLRFYPLAKRQERNTSMTDTLNRPFTDRRHFLGAAMGLAGMLGLGSVKHVTAQEATAAATAVEDYVWTPPQYDPEPALFNVLERNDDTVILETIDGQVEVPADPQRIVALAWEYVPLFELGVADRIVGVAIGSDELFGAGVLTEVMHTALANVSRIPLLDLDLEQIIELNPDLILTGPWWPEDTDALAQIAPLIRSSTTASSAPRSAVRDFGALFGQNDVAANLIAEHEDFVERARQKVAPVVANKKAACISWADDAIDVLPSYYVENDQVFSLIDLPYPLHRELRITPSSFIEQHADNDDRQSLFVRVSTEMVRDIDADYFFVTSRAYDNFISNPLVQQTIAGQNNQIHLYDTDGIVHFGLAGAQAGITNIIRSLTGETFE